MSLFDGRIKTGTRIDLDGDDFSPNMGALVGSSHKEDVLNHGTLNQVVQGNVTRLFFVNETITVNANQTLTVLANRSATIGANDSLTVAANLTETVCGMVTQTYGGGQMTTCAGPHVRTDVTNSVWMCPAGTFINSGDLYEFKLTNFRGYGLKHHHVAIAVDVIGLKSQIVVAKNKSAAIETKLQNVSNRVVAGIRNTAAATTLAAHLCLSRVSGTQAEVRALRPAVGIEISAPPTSLPGAQ